LDVAQFKDWSRAEHHPTGTSIDTPCG
jgi:hypothetical protein